MLPLSSYGQWEHYGGVYYAYPEKDIPRQSATPKGYKPFYISHYSRHGSRWLPDDSRYEAVCRQFSDTLNLTQLGKDLRQRLLLIYANAKGRGGDLTSVGAQQLKRMAERMFVNYPEVFYDSAQIDAQSSIVGRCIMSMSYFLIRLAQMKPSLRITAEANCRYMDYIAYTSPEQKILENNVPNNWRMNPSRLIQSLFVDTAKIANQYYLASELHTIASDMQDVNIGISLYDIFNENEMRQIYDMNNERMSLCNGINAFNKKTPQKSALSLWQNIVESADDAIIHGKPAVTLRFGHDTSLYRLFSFLGLYPNENRMDFIIPMGANLQIIFYRNSESNVLVKFLHNEHEIFLPMKSETEPYYNWESVKKIYRTYYLK